MPQTFEGKMKLSFTQNVALPYNKMSDSQDELSGSEQFMLIMAGIGLLGACIATTFQFILKSRCTTLSCCWKSCECDRDVLPSGQATLDTSALQTVQARVSRP